MFGRPNETKIREQIVEQIYMHPEHMMFLAKWRQWHFEFWGTIHGRRNT
jgi:hypothetical protein